MIYIHKPFHFSRAAFCVSISLKLLLLPPSIPASGKLLRDTVLKILLCGVDPCGVQTLISVFPVQSHSSRNLRTLNPTMVVKGVDTVPKIEDFKELHNLVTHHIQSFDYMKEKGLEVMFNRIQPVSIFDPDTENKLTNILFFTYRL